MPYLYWTSVHLLFHTGSLASTILMPNANGCPVRSPLGRLIDQTRLSETETYILYLAGFILYSPRPHCMSV